MPLHPSQPLSPMQELKAAEEELASARQAGDPQRLGLALATCAELWNDGRAFKRALELYSECLPLIREHGDTEDLAGVLASMITSLGHAGQTELAVAYADEARSLFQLSGNHDGEASTLINLSNLWRQLRQPQRALDLLATAVELSRTSVDRRMLAVALVNTGVALSEMGQREAAQAKLLEALGLAKRLNMPGMADNIEQLLEQSRSGRPQTVTRKVPPPTGFS